MKKCILCGKLFEPNSIQSKTIKERVEAVCLERYGVPYP